MSNLDAINTFWEGLKEFFIVNNKLKHIKQINTFNGKDSYFINISLVNNHCIKFNFISNGTFYYLPYIDTIETYKQMAFFLDGYIFLPTSKETTQISVSAKYREKNSIYTVCFLEIYHYNEVFSKVSVYSENMHLECIKYLKNNKLHNDDGPAHLDYWENGVCSTMLYYANNVLHRNDDEPAVMEYDYLGNIRKLEYHKNGKLHRENGACITEFYSDGSVEKEEFYTNNKLDRDSDVGPAVERYNRKGDTIERSFFRNGERTCKVDENNKKPIKEKPTQEVFTHKGDLLIRNYFLNDLEHCPDEDTPSSIEYHPHKIIKYTSYCIEGRLIEKKDGKPSCQRFFRGGGTYHEIFVKNNTEHQIFYNQKGLKLSEEFKTYFSFKNFPERHNDNGPAIIKYDPITGKKKTEECWKHGKKISVQKFIK